MGNFGFVIVGVIALDIFIWVWLIISDKKTLIHYDFLPRTKESLDAEVRNAIVKIDTNNSSHCRYCGAEMAPGSKYCGICGKSQFPKQSKYFSSGHKGTIKQVNQWLAENPNVKNVTMNVELGKGIGAFTYRSVITSIELQYGLILSVDQPFSRIMKINYQNTAANDFSLGWVDKSAEVVAVTDKGEYSGKIVGAFGNDSKLKHGKKGFFLAIFKDIDGNVEQLNFNGILYLKDDGLPEHNTGFGNMSDKEAQVQLLITHNNGDTSTNLLSENPDTETAENQNTEITTEESRQQYKVTTGGTRLNIRKEPRADAEILQKLGDGVVCDATGNKSEDGSWIEVIIPESDQTGWANAQYLTEIPVEQSINVGGREITTSDIQRMQDFMSSSLPDAEFTDEEIEEMFQN